MQQHPLPLPLLLTLLLLTITLLPLPSLCTPPSSANFPSRLPLPRDRLFCAGPLPPGTYGGTLPAQAIRYKLASLACGDKAPWSAANFTDLADLCTVGGNPEGNMGGMVRLFLSVFPYSIFPQSLGSRRASSTKLLCITTICVFRFGIVVVVVIATG